MEGFTRVFNFTGFGVLVFVSFRFVLLLLQALLGILLDYLGLFLGP